LKQGRDQRPQRFDPVGRCGENNDGNQQSGEVLLILEILVGGHEHIEAVACQAQQFTVLDAPSAHRRHGANVVFGQ